MGGHCANSIAKQRFVVSWILEVSSRSPRLDATAVHLSISSDAQEETVKKKKKREMRSEKEETDQKMLHLSPDVK